MEEGTWAHGEVDLTSTTPDSTFLRVKYIGTEQKLNPWADETDWELRCNSWDQRSAPHLPRRQLPTPRPEHDCWNCAKIVADAVAKNRRLGYAIRWRKRTKGEKSAKGKKRLKVAKLAPGFPIDWRQALVSTRQPVRSAWEEPLPDEPLDSWQSLERHWRRSRPGWVDKQILTKAGLWPRVMRRLPLGILEKIPIPVGVDPYAREYTPDLADPPKPTDTDTGAAHRRPTVAETDELLKLAGRGSSLDWDARGLGAGLEDYDHAGILGLLLEYWDDESLDLAIAGQSDDSDPDLFVGGYEGRRYDPSLEGDHARWLLDVLLWDYEWQEQRKNKGSKAEWNNGTEKTCRNPDWDDWVEGGLGGLDPESDYWLIDDLYTRPHMLDRYGGPRPGEAVDVGAVVAAAKAGDRDALTELVLRYDRAVWFQGFGRDRTWKPSPNEADDMMQEAWLKVLENIDQVKDPERFQTWLVETVRNKSRDRWRAIGQDEWELDNIPDKDGRRRRMKRRRNDPDRPELGFAPSLTELRVESDWDPADNDEEGSEVDDDGAGCQCETLGDPGDRLAIATMLRDLWWEREGRPAIYKAARSLSTPHWRPWLLRYDINADKHRGVEDLARREQVSHEAIRQRLSRVNAGLRRQLADLDPKHHGDVDVVLSVVKREKVNRPFQLLVCVKRSRTAGAPALYECHRIGDSSSYLVGRTAQDRLVDTRGSMLLPCVLPDGTNCRLHPRCKFCDQRVGRSVS